MKDGECRRRRPSPSIMRVAKQIQSHTTENTSTRTTRDGPTQINRLSKYSAGQKNCEGPLGFLYEDRRRW